MKKALAYARFSTDMQREESIDAQFRAIELYAQRNDIEIIYTFKDEGISGTTDERPQFQKMIGIAETLNDLDYIIVHKLDRFARNRYDSAIYKNKIKQNGVRVLSVLENLDDSPESVILESVLEGMSEYFSKNLSREVKKGMKENALKCKFNGGTPPLGYDVDENNFYIINEKEAEIIRIIFEMYSSGKTQGEIIDYLNLRGYKTKKGKTFKKTSLIEILRNEKYIGNYIFGKENYDGFRGKRNSHSYKKREDMIVIENGIPAIITKEQWQMVNNKRESNKRKSSNKAKRTYILSGILYCECGSPMSGTSRTGMGGKYYYYSCNRKKREKDCPSTSIRADKLEKQVLEIFDEAIFNKNNKEVLVSKITEYINIKITTKTDETAPLLKELETVQSQIDNLVNFIMLGQASSSVSEKIATLELKKEELKLNLANLNKTETMIINEEKIINFLNKYDSIFKFTPEEQKEILSMFIEKITISYDKKVKITLKIIDETKETSEKVCTEKVSDFPHHYYTHCLSLEFQFNSI